MLHGLIAFLIFAVIVIVVAYAIILVLRRIPGVPGEFISLGVLVVGVVAFLVILMKALPLLGIEGL